MFGNNKTLSCGCRVKTICPCCVQSQYQSSNLEPFFCPRLKTYVLRGPRGFTGPRGLQGMPGVNSITSFASFASLALQPLTPNADVLLSSVIIHGTAITHSGTNIGLGAGSYLVVYNLDVSQQLEGSVTFSLIVNNTSNSNSQVEALAPAGGMVAMGANTIVNVANNSTMTLRNIGSQSVTAQNVSLSILKIA